MKNINGWVLALFISIVGGAIGCQGPNNATVAKQAKVSGDNSRNALDWNGTYVADLPCADCPGIRSVLTLMDDEHYEMRWVYLERGDSVFVEKGTFTWDSTGSIIQLSEGAQQTYQVGENQLFHLDGDGKRITGDLASHFIFNKKEIGFNHTPWRLVQVNNVLRSDYPTSQDPYIQFLEERVVGSGGCNRISGTFQTHNTNGLTFGAIVSTRMACPEMQLEFLVHKAMEQVTSYNLKENHLLLSDADGNVIMQFEADYLKGTL
jgi:copper homeostasis protein (lipoprotein)